MQHLGTQVFPQLFKIFPNFALKSSNKILMLLLKKQTPTLAQGMGTQPMKNTQITSMYE